MDWELNPCATKVAKDIFPQYAANVRVKQHGEQYLIQPTPYGVIELLPLQRGFLIAAENPPPSAAVNIDPAELDVRIQHYLEKNGLRPWKITSNGKCTEVIRLLAAEKDVEGQGQEAIPPFSQYISGLNRTGALVGEARLRCFENLATLVKAQQPAGPVVQLVGLRGIGKRTMAASLALHGYRLGGELVLSRLLVKRIFTTPIELVVETLLAGNKSMESEDLLVISDAELLETMPRSIRDQVIHELARLPHVVLTARSRRKQSAVDHLLRLDVPGLTVAEARFLIAAEYPNIEFAGSAMDLLIQSCHSTAGILPGRLLYLTDLAQAILGPAPNYLDSHEPTDKQDHQDGEDRQKQDEIVLAPDEIAAALRMVGSAWARNTASRKA
jgi:hypothetical protein